MMSAISFKTFHFADLSVATLYSLLKLRSDVFVVEQDCVYPDLDNKDIDPRAVHICSFDSAQENVVAYARCLPPSVSFEGSSIGRVVVATSHRGQGLAEVLMQESIAYCQRKWPEQRVQIGAQCYLQRFYEGLGFECFSEPYDEDGIMHVDMQLPSQTRSK
jgi:ElaA protein